MKVLGGFGYEIAKQREDDPSYGFVTDVNIEVDDGALVHVHS